MNKYLKLCKNVLYVTNTVVTITALVLYFKASPEQRECVKLIYRDKNVKRYRCKDGTIKMYIK